MKIALLQIAPTGSPERNLRKGMDACRKAKALGADLALFPEMWSNGYNIYGRPASVWTAEAIAPDSEFVNSFGMLAKELNMAVCITFLEACETGPRNTATLFDCKGKRLTDYAKVHTCDFDAERSLTPGEDFYVVDLNTQDGPVKVGLMICYDREFPESARILMLKGAEIVLVPNACPMEQNRLSQLRGRAYENMMGIATCNYPDTVPDCNGHSSAFDGVAYLPDLPGSRDMCILEADSTEGIYIADFDLEMIRNYRETEVHGNTFRRPDKYHMLIEEEVQAPFLRNTRRK